MAYAQVRDVGGGVIKQSYVAATSKAQAIIAECTHCDAAGLSTPPNIELEMELVIACLAKNCCDDGHHRIVDHGIFEHDAYYHWKMVLDQGRMNCGLGPPFWMDDPRHGEPCSWGSYQLDDFGRWEVWGMDGCAGALDYWDFKAIMTRVQITNRIVGPPEKLQGQIAVYLWGERQSDGVDICEQIFLNTNLEWETGTTCWDNGYGVWWDNQRVCDVPVAPHFGDGRTRINQYPPP